MSTKSHPLMNDWTLIAHPSYQIFANKNSYVVVDDDSDVVIRFTVQKNEVEIFSSNWDLNYKVNIGFKTIKIITAPEGS
jgi:hypothetical protein